MIKRRQRRIYLVDRQVQGALLFRAARHWVLSVTAVGMLTVLGWMFISPGVGVLVEIRQQLPSLLGSVTIAVIASLAVLPVILFDLAKMTNRFAGPMFHMRRVMQQAAEGKSVQPIIFRDGDYWQDFAEDFNQLIGRLNSQANRGESAEIDQQEPAELLEVGK